MSWQGPLCAFCFLFKIFSLLWRSNGGCFPLYFVWMMSLTMIMDPLTRLQWTDLDHRGRGCMTRTNTNTQTGFLLSVISFCLTYRTTLVTQRLPTPASPPSLSPFRSTASWNNDTAQPCTAHWKERQWSHQGSSEKLRDFKLWGTQSGQSGYTKKANCLEKKCWVLHLFSMQPPVAADPLSLSQTAFLNPIHCHSY